MSPIKRNPVLSIWVHLRCEQQRCGSACPSTQSDLHLVAHCTDSTLPQVFLSEISSFLLATIAAETSYTPGIYAEGYIVFVFPFVRSYVRMFVRSFVRSFVLPSVTWNLRQSFASKFLKWCISQQLLIRKHSYLDHSYPGGLAFTP